LCRCAFAQQLNSYSTSWIGNTFGGAGDTSGNYGNNYLNNVQMGFDAVGSGTDGTVYTELSWDESHDEMGIYKNRATLGQPNQAGPGANWLLDQWDFNNADGGAVAISGSWAFLTVDRTVNSSTQGPGWLRRYQRSSYNPDPSFSGTSPGDIHLSTNTIQGLSLLSSGTQLSVFASVSDTNGRIVVLDGNAFVQTNQFAFQSGTGNPGRSAVDNAGYLWIIDYAGANPVVRQYSTAGVSQNVAITFASGVQPADIAFNPVTKLLMVADSGTAQDIKLYNPLQISGTPTTLSGTFGAPGGINSGTDGQVAPLKFFSPSSVSTDGSGNIYVGMTNETIQHQLGGSLASYTYGGALNWELDNLTYIDIADVDPGSETDVYTKNKRFAMNYSLTSGSEWSYAAHTIDPVKYPQDLRISSATFGKCTLLAMRRINDSVGSSHLFMYVTDMYANYLAIYRFNSATDGDVAVPCGFISKSHITGGWPPVQPATGEWIWRDGSVISGTGGTATLDGGFQNGEFLLNGGNNAPSNAWGWNVDSHGNVYLASDTGGIREYPCQGLDGNNIPIYNYTTMTTTATPAPFTDVFRAEYDATNDAMYLCGYTAGYPNLYQTGTNSKGQPVYGPLWGKGAGRVLAKYPKWSQGNRTEAFEIDNLIYEPNDIYMKGGPNASSIAFSGNYLFVQWGATSPNDAPNTQQTQVYSAATGAFLGYLLPTGQGSIGVAQIDIPFGLKAYQRSNGEYLVFVEDDWFGKVLMYRWTPDPAQAGIFVNCGGVAASPFVSDTNYVGGVVASTGSAINLSEVTNPAPQAVYQTNRYASPGAGNSFTYTLGGFTPNATYLVRLHFAEDYFNSAGARLFNVSINNQRVLTNFDIFAAAGGEDVANIQQYWATSDTNGAFTIVFSNGSKNNAQCNGIEIDPTPPSMPAGLTSASGSTQITLSWAPSAGTDVYNIYRTTNTTNTGSPFILIASSTSTSFTDIGLTDTNDYYYIVAASNGGGEILNSTQLTATVTLPPLQIWRQQNFGTLDPADPVGGNTADPAQCGISNLMRYALGLNLNGASAGGLPVVGQSGSYGTLTFTRCKADIDITYHVEASNDLKTWSEIWNSTNAPYTGGINPEAEVIISDTVPMSGAPGAKRFLELEVTNP